MAMPRYFCVMDFEATCDTDEVIIASVNGVGQVCALNHRLCTGDQVRYFRESRNSHGGCRIKVDGIEIDDEVVFYVRVLDSNTLMLFKSQEDAEQNQNPVLVEQGFGAKTTFRDESSIKKVTSVDAESHLFSANHRLCTGNIAKYMGGQMKEAGSAIPTGKDFFVRCMDPHILKLFNTREDAECNRNSVLIDKAVTIDAIFQVKAGMHFVPEIIEFPAVLIDATSLEPVAEFREIVKPTETPILSDFCTQLTSITQAEVDKGKPLDVVLDRFGAWLQAQGAEDAIPVTCGDWDLGIMLPKESKRKHLENKVPAALSRWCNIKKPFADAQKAARAPGMDGMLKALGITLVGHHHLGIDDSRNIARILQVLVRSYGQLIEATGQHQVKVPNNKVQDTPEEIERKKAARALRKANAQQNGATDTRATQNASLSLGTGRLTHHHLSEIGLSPYMVSNYNLYF